MDVLQPIQGGSAATKKLTSAFGLLLLGGGIGLNIAAGSKIWHDFNKGNAQKEKDAPAILMMAIVIVFAMIVFVTFPVWTGLLRGFMGLGTPRLIAGGILFGLALVGLSLRSRFVGELFPIDEDTARCPNGTEIRKTAENNCKLSIDQCPGEIKLTSVWKWWEIPGMALGGSIVFLAWVYLVYIFFKRKGNM